MNRNQAKRSAPWMEQTLKQQLSAERDFPHGTTIRKQYAILCTHRSGSNLLSEALYATGCAGDPMEYFNLRMLNMLYESRNVQSIGYEAYLAEMQHRRTSPNGVFGFNIKADQFSLYFKNAIAAGSRLIRNCDYVVFLYREDKIKQAISAYIGNRRDTFRIPADADSNEIEQLVADVPFDPVAISRNIMSILRQERMWLSFLRQHNIPYSVLTYERLVENYAGSLKALLDKLGVDNTEWSVPERPTKQVTTVRNTELEAQYLALVSGRDELLRGLPAGRLLV